MKKIRPTVIEILMVIAIIAIISGTWWQEIKNAYESITEVVTGVEYIDSESYSKIEKEISILEGKVFDLEKRVEEIIKK